MTTRATEADRPIRLSVAVHAPGDERRAAAALGSDRSAWLGPVVEDRSLPAGVSRHLVDLELRLGERRVLAARKSALVDVGATAADRDGVSVEIAWRAATLTPLFPVFAGTLAWRGDELSVEGYYAPPGGGVGLVADRLILHSVARATARSLLERIADRIAAEPLADEPAPDDG